MPTVAEIANAHLLGLRLGRANAEHSVAASIEQLNSIVSDGAKDEVVDRAPEEAGEPSVPGEISMLEIEILATILRAARDMHDLTNTAYDMKKAELYAADQMPRREKGLRLALINRRRSDIADPDAKGTDALSNRTLRWKKTALTSTITVNRHAIGGWQYEFVKWRNEIVEGIKVAVKNKSNVIAYGEFDFPPEFPDQDKSIEDFENSIIEIINDADQPIVLFAGTRHVFEPKKTEIKEGNATVDLVHETSASNVGHVFFNDVILKGMRGEDGSRLAKIYKRTPAMKAGEKLSRVEEGIHQYSAFSTIIGRIAFLICADAYDPLIAFDIFLKSSDDQLRPQLIIVPAYNRSPKLGHMCQILSFLTQSIVVLLDVCSEGRRKKATEIWNCGNVANSEIGLIQREDCNISANSNAVMHIWDINWEDVDLFKSKISLEREIPLFHKARELAKTEGKPIV